MNVLLLPQSAINGTTALITDRQQLTHLHQVLNIKVGDMLKVGVFGGLLGSGRVVAFDEQNCQLEQVVLDQAPPPKLDLTVVLALPRPKVLRRLIMDMTAFGVAHIVLINSVRTDKSYWGSPILTRLDEFVQEGLQQGIDSKAPKITKAKRFKPFVQDELPTLLNNQPAVVFHPYAYQSANAYFAHQNQLPKVVVIGAEGGFVPYEIDLLASVGVQAVTLGRRILRTESAVNAVLGRWL